MRKYLVALASIGFVLSACAKSQPTLGAFEMSKGYGGARSSSAEASGL